MKGAEEVRQDSLASVVANRRGGWGVFIEYSPSEDRVWSSSSSHTRLLTNASSRLIFSHFDQSCLLARETRFDIFPRSHDLPTLGKCFTTRPARIVFLV